MDKDLANLLKEVKNKRAVVDRAEAAVKQAKVVEETARQDLEVARLEFLYAKGDLYEYAMTYEDGHG